MSDSEDYGGPEQVEALKRALDSLAPFKIDVSQLMFLDGPALGSGGFSIVRKATLGTRYVAVKELFPGRPKTIRMALGFAREMLIWSRLCHSNILPVRNFYLDLDAGHAYMISLHISRGSLTKFLSTGETTPFERVTWVADVMHGLVYLHTLEPAVIHGDLKPENIPVKQNWTAVLCDFGVSRFVEQTLPSGLTTSRSVKGSTRWLSPELFSDVGHSLASDIWAWALTSLQILTGKYPYHTTTSEAAVVFRILSGQVPSSNEHIELPRTDPFWEVLKLCWAAEPASRPTATDCWRMTEFPSLLTRFVPGAPRYFSPQPPAPSASSAHPGASSGSLTDLHGTNVATVSSSSERTFAVDSLSISTRGTNEDDIRDSRSRTDCDLCRMRRVQCDQLRPICGRCAQHQLDCGWSDSPMETRIGRSPFKSHQLAAPSGSASGSYQSVEAWKRRSRSRMSGTSGSGSEW